MWEYQQRYNLVKLCFVSDPYVNVVLYRGSRASGQIDSTHTKVKKKVRSGIWNNLHWTVIVTLTSEVFSCKILNLRDITAECMHVVKKLMLLKLYICILSVQPHIFFCFWSLVCTVHLYWLRGQPGVFGARYAGVLWFCYYVQTLHPRWHEEFLFRVNPRDNKLMLEVYDENRIVRILS